MLVGLRSLDMKSPEKQESSGKGTARIVSVVGLILVWGIVWANLPSKDELWSAQLSSGVAAKRPAVEKLDLTIPGLPAAPPSNAPIASGGSAPVGSQRASELHQVRQITELKCDAELQQRCPESLSGIDRQECVVHHIKELLPACQHIVRQRLVRWKEAGSYRFICAEDVERLCRGMEAGEDRVLQCLQEHAQHVSEPCYQSLPKGHLQLKN
jgi:hypothetical protein